MAEKEKKKSFIQRLRDRRKSLEEGVPMDSKDMWYESEEKKKKMPKK